MQFNTSLYRYAVILFHDHTSRPLLDEWLEAAALPQMEGVSDSECIMAHMDADDPEIEEVKLTYSLSTPGIKVFRRGIMSDWRGPFEANAIANYIIEDSMPSVKVLSKLEDVKENLLRRNKTIILGFFTELALQEGSGDSGFSSNPW